MYSRGNEIDLSRALRRLPDAVAVVRGSAEYKEIYGTVKLFSAAHGVLVVADVLGLPASSPCGGGIFALHIHGGTACTGNAEDPFADAGTHYNPRGCPHPYHAGDLPPLFSAGGQAFSAFLTDRFAVAEVLGRVVVIHDRPDDFTTQPAGNAGKRIACGVISPVRR